MKIDFVLKDKPALENPIIVCGLPGSAFVGKFAVDHLINELPAKILAEIYSDVLPPQVSIKDDGTASLLHNELYFWKNSNPGTSDIVFYTGDAQPANPESEYSLSEAIIDFVVKEYGVKKLITLGAYVTGSPPNQVPKVYAAVTDQSLTRAISEAGCEIMNSGAITGMNGLLLGMARLKGLSGFTLLGETSGYTFEAKAPESVLGSLAKLLGINVDYKKLEERANEAQEIVKAIDKARRQQQGFPIEEGGQGERKKTDYIS